MSCGNRSFSRETPQTLDYIERVVPGYSSQTFKQHFRVSPDTFDYMLNLLGDDLSRTESKSGRKPISAKVQLMIALWFMATPDSYRSVHVTFGVGKATAFRAVRRVVKTLYCLAPRVIKWPKDQYLEVMTSFEQKAGFPNMAPTLKYESLKLIQNLTCKGFYSVNLQAVCNSQCIFTHCFAGFPGAVHDARIFRNSPVNDFLNDPSYFPENSHIIGDAAYPLHQNLLVLFRNNGHLTVRQRNYNYCLSSTRMCIERSFGLVKVRFRILLDCLLLADMKHIPQFIIACTVLHNICQIRNDHLELFMLANQEEQVVLVPQEEVTGQAKRLAIMNNLRIRRKGTFLRSAIPAITKLQAVLYFLATGCSLRTLTHIFRLGKSTISEFIVEVCEAIYGSLREFIKIPSTADWKIIENGFRKQWNFPGCCGAIDGKHVVIKASPDSGSLYYNYKETNSIILMAVVDYKYCFSYIDVGCNGRVSDGGVFHNCALYQELENGVLPENHVLVGDNAFPLKEYLLKPFPGNQLTSKQKIFNYRLSRARRIVENGFGILAARFRVFEKPMPYSPEKVVKIVKACCVLHNWLRHTKLQSKRYEYTVDTENHETGVIDPGSWRNEPLSLGIQPLPVSLSNRSSQRSIDRRESYADYFVGRGSVPWQTRMIH
nr:unnamed protein product [Callosobruchus analis]